MELNPKDLSRLFWRNRDKVQMEKMEFNWWFAWYPVRIEDENVYIWMETVKRKRVADGWRYRRICWPWFRSKRGI